MSLVDEPIYMKRNCSPVCEHNKECVRCHRPKCIRQMMHSRQFGYVCLCGSQEYEPVFNVSIPSTVEKCTETAHAFLRDKAGHKFCYKCGEKLK